MNHDTGPLPLDLYALGRGLAYAATLALIGACVFAALLPRWRDEEDDETALAARGLDRAWRVAGGAAALLLCAHLLRAYGQVRSFLDPIEPTTWDFTRAALTQTTWGRGWMAQVAAAALSLLMALLAPRRSAAGVQLLGTAALAVTCTSPLTGHAVEHPWGLPLGVGLHALHLIGGGVWLGTLLSILVAGLRAITTPSLPRDHAAVARMITVFSPVALTGAGLAVGAGLLMAYAYIGDFASLWGTTYGRTLLVKTGLLVITMALGAWNWRRVTPRLGSSRGTSELTRSATIELCIGALLLAATAVLVALPAPKV
ncbi:MAG: CopD family protein [Gemmatimonadota bacterium]